MISHDVLRYLAWRFDASNRTEEDEDPREQKTKCKIPLDDVTVHVYTRRHAQHFVPAFIDYCFTVKTTFNDSQKNSNAASKIEW